MGNNWHLRQKLFVVAAINHDCLKIECAVNSYRHTKKPYRDILLQRYSPEKNLTEISLTFVSKSIFSTNVERFLKKYNLYFQQILRTLRGVFFVCMASLDTYYSHCHFASCLKQSIGDVLGTHCARWKYAKPNFVNLLNDRRYSTVHAISSAISIRYHILVCLIWHI